MYTWPDGTVQHTGEGSSGSEFGANFMETSQVCWHWTCHRLSRFSASCWSYNPHAFISTLFNLKYRTCFSADYKLFSIGDILTLCEFRGSIIGHKTCAECMRALKDSDFNVPKTYPSLRDFGPDTIVHEVIHVSLSMKPPPLYTPGPGTYPVP